jgi:hypothetical protein
MRLRGGGLWICVVLLALAAALPSAAVGATVANGDFETGNLSGWHESHVTEAGDWYAYKGTEPPRGSQSAVKSVEAPPQGRFAAITDQIDPDTLTLWQDVALEPEATHILSLTAYYQSQLPLSTPSPDSLSVEEEAIGQQPNEQYRIDVMKPSAPLDSLNPEDILATVFKTETGSSQQMKPTRFSADLTSFAGQTVRIRAVVVNRLDPVLREEEEREREERHEANPPLKGVLNAGIDAVSIKSSGPGVSGGKGNGAGNGGSRGKLSFGRASQNPRNGTVLLPVKVPAAGLVTATGAKQHPKLLVAVKKRLAGATTAKLLLKPTPAALHILEAKHRLRARVAVRFNPDRGAAETATVSIVFRLAPKRH